MRVVTWNVNSFTWRRNKAKIALLGQLEWDVALLQEVSARSFTEFVEGLGAGGVCALDLVGKTEHDVPLAAVVLVRRGDVRTPVALDGIPRSERFVAADVTAAGTEVRVASWHAPNAAGDGGQAKMQGYRRVAGWASEQAHHATVLGADTNAWENGWAQVEPDPEHDHYVEHAFHYEPTSHGLRDAFRDVLAKDPARRRALEQRRPGASLATTYVRGGRNAPVAERMDRLFISDQIETVEVEHILSDAFAVGSDHAIVSAELVVREPMSTPDE